MSVATSEKLATSAAAAYGAAANVVVVAVEVVVFARAEGSGNAVMLSFPVLVVPVATVVVGHSTWG